MQLHGDENLVSNLVERKIQSGEYREHPDLPDDDSAVMFYVLTDLGTLNEEETEEKMQVTTNVAVEMGTQASKWQNSSIPSLQHLDLSRQ